MALVSLCLTIYRDRHVVITGCESYRGRLGGVCRRHRVHSKVHEDRENTCRVEMTKYAHTHTHTLTHSHTHTHILTQMVLNFMLFTPCIFLHSV